ncbi:aminopeptidase N [Orrella marina]|uniref:Aminopeptidase N n=1 Tax=Orrella marina TaxID=2163011 RepID=A0A2R4XFR9_9BURK|nr:aminopeptidase N [Orrella marina]AWB32660.1 aminopeptidase N [Orrella marina]
MTIQRTDYTPYPYELPAIHLEFDLDPKCTLVHTKIDVKAKADTMTGEALILDGEAIDLRGLRIDGQSWDHYELDKDLGKLIIRSLPRACTLEIDSSCNPSSNDALMGLYVSGKSLFTQCEPEGFRRISWFADRPDVMSRFQVTLRADPDVYPILLSNGNRIHAEQLPDGRQSCVWEDPFLKPSYLFALVAGQFDCREQTVRTRSGREVLLQIYSDPGTFDRTLWAMESLIRALRWDESRFDLELDLDRFMIVVAADFNMGAMENKGLNVFNAAYVLADPETATDSNFEGIEAVIGHEYFHNWTGNRVTCRDWFQLSLKEGLTVFRDQEFTADMKAEGLDPARAASARSVKRIDDVAMLRAAQFPEDAGPMAHPIRPQSYEEISNFYTATVYEKGAEVIRMMHTLLGEEIFQLGMKEYFRRHDGQAVTCDDFVDAMQHAWQTRHPERDLTVFARWYSQAGTPSVKVTTERTSEHDQIRLTLSQQCPPVGVERNANIEKQPFHIPVLLGAINQQGESLTLQCDEQHGQTLLLELTRQSQSWLINGWTQDAAGSFLRDFSAPVRLEISQPQEALHRLARHDPNAFARWEATQILLSNAVLKLAELADDGQARTDLPESLTTSIHTLSDTFSLILQDTTLDDAYRTRLLEMPSDKYLLHQMDQMDPLAVAQAKNRLVQILARPLETALVQIVTEAQADGDDSKDVFDPSALAAGRRALVNLALDWLCQMGSTQGKALALAQYDRAGNMTARLGALLALFRHPEHDSAVLDASESFYTRFQDNALVIDKWFALQASAPTTDVAKARSLMQHPAFNRRNPNRVRALLFQFCANNPLGFHAADGSGYQFWAEQVIDLDRSNPEVAARLARVLDHWRHHRPVTQDMMQAALQSVADQSDLSPNTREVVGKALAL